MHAHGAQDLTRDADRERFRPRDDLVLRSARRQFRARGPHAIGERGNRSYDPLTRRALNGGGTLAVLPFILLLRFGLGAVSYAAGTPGGLFAPLLVVGAQLGLCFGLLCRVAFPELDIAPQGFAVVGMAAFFAGVVRAPLTGITLVVEMTANVTMLLPMLGACFVAMLVPALLRNPPIYDSLREQTRRDGTR